MWFNNQKQNSKKLGTGLRRLEGRLERLIEGSAMRLFPTSQHDLTASLVGALRQGIIKSSDGELLGPNLFRLEVSPARVELTRSDAAFLEGLRGSLQEAGEEIGLRFSGPFSVQVDAAPDLADDQMRVSAIHSQIGLTGTSTIETETPDQSARIPSNAFLIINGMEVYPLRVALLNIGRRADNHLIIDDPRISRVHAQLRLVHGRFVIFDLESSGGTWVNGERIHQRVLQPGDVISLSGVPLVYGQDSHLADETQRMSIS